MRMVKLLFILGFAITLSSCMGTIAKYYYEETTDPNARKTVMVKKEVIQNFRMWDHPPVIADVLIKKQPAIRGSAEAGPYSPI